MTLDEYLLEADELETKKLEKIRKRSSQLIMLDPDLSYITTYSYNSKILLENYRNVSFIIPSLYMIRIAVSIMAYNLSTEKKNIVAEKGFIDQALLKSIIRYLYTRRFNRKVDIDMYNITIVNNSIKEKSIPRLFDVPEKIKQINNKLSLIGEEGIYFGFDDVIMSDKDKQNKLGIINTVIYNTTEFMYSLLADEYVTDRLELLNSDAIQYIDLIYDGNFSIISKEQFKQKQKLNGKKFSENRFYYY